jgi:hypothetical protein
VQLQWRDRYGFSQPDENMRTLLTATALLILGACDSANPPEAPADLLPLAVGNQWIVQVTTTPPDGPPTVEIDTIRVTQKVLFGGRDWYHLESRLGLISGAFQNREDGVWRIEQGVEWLAFPASLPTGTAVTTRSGQTVQITNPVAGYAIPGLGRVTAVEYRERYTRMHDRYMGELTVRPELQLTRALARGVGFVRFDCAYLTLQGDRTLKPYAEVKVDLLGFHEAG